MSTLYIYIGIHACLLIWVFINQHYMPGLQSFNTIKQKDLVSVLIPLRNEERNVSGLIQSLKALSYSNLEFIFLDDQSTDHTKALLEQEIKQLPHAKILDGSALPPSWVGKNFACHQLSQHAKGTYLLFLDADVRLASTAIDVSLHTLQHRTAGLLSGFPKFPVKGLLAMLAVPMQHVFIYLHLPLMLANNSKLPQASAAHGSFMFFNSAIYHAIGGHQAVKSSLVEDVHLARLVKQKGFSTCLANVTNYVSCNMYQSNKDVWAGFSKNAFPGIGKSWLLAAFVIFFYSFIFVLPVGLLWFAFSSHWLYSIPFALSVITKGAIDYLAAQKAWIAILMPLSALVIIAILLRSMSLTVLKSGYSWKGRTYS
ncbi:glycosyltransferase [Alkalicoccobacillus porphyridii]|uniref:4,4'-diaponeurosporenoate glycosyltransferase n=1 Tax=Alkalicoccobacillus porphyridii TaxID=2597270 RepID=A0A553ZYX5_9BACI|nr:glycosyltransferase [Alkalicoccobacillus porphyridii]TSB46586.1 glycosyltransferase [Alkalicoccobacillus porphyridii]